MPLQLDAFYCMITPQEQMFGNEGLELNKGLPRQLNTECLRMKQKHLSQFLLFIEIHCRLL